MDSLSDQWILPLLVGLGSAAVLYGVGLGLQRLGRQVQVLKWDNRLVWFRHSPLYPVYGLALVFFWGGVGWLVADQPDVSFFPLFLLAALTTSIFLALCIRGGTWHVLQGATLQTRILFVPVRSQEFPGKESIHQKDESVCWGKQVLLHSPSPMVREELMAALTKRFPRSPTAGI